MENNKLWGGRFTESTDANLEKLNSSINFDKRMFAEDIEGSKAYASALEKINLLSEQETSLICDGLDKVKIEWEKNVFETKHGDEDIHTANERRLQEIIGEPASKLHVGRSRNDQVVTDMKLWLRTHLKELGNTVRSLIKVIVDRSSHEVDIMMPGYTHLQRAQPVRWSHYLLSHAWNLKKDCDRLDDILKLINVMPLGSGALAGNPFNVDRISLAKALGFDSVTKNSMHAVGDRDFIAEFLFWASMVGIHLSRLAEDLILYSSKEFEFVTIDDSYSTGSSLMPQKRNPDSLELIRGIGGSLFGQVLLSPR
jgi:argininosuccinate lyase